MKKFLSSICALFLLIGASLLLSSCSKVSGSIDNVYLPQTTFVREQEPDFSKGQLTVRYSDGKVEYIPLDAEGIVISGYDVHLTGEQKLTVTYRGMTATVTVNTVKRMQEDVNVEVEYFVGEQFNRDKGNLIITHDDGTSMNVPMSDSRILVEGFDGTKAGKRQVTLKYEDSATSRRYSDTLDVEIIAPSTAPRLNRTKLDNVRSHIGQADFSGTYIIFEGVKADGASRTKNIALNDSRVKITGIDFDNLQPSADPILQTANVTYAGYDFELPITITYSNVSYVKFYLQYFKDIDWTQEDSSLESELQITSVLTAMSYYQKLTSAEKREYFTAEDRQQLVIPATLLCYYNAAALLNSYAEQTFGIGEDGGFVIIGANYYYASVAYAELSSENCALFRYLDTIEFICNEPNLRNQHFLNESAKGNTMYDLLKEFPTKSDIRTYVMPALKYMIDLYDSLDDIPDDWTLEDLTDKSARFDELYSMMANSPYWGSEFRYIYEAVDGWRAEADFFLILYTYYYQDIEENIKILEALANNALLPTELEELYRFALSAYNYLRSIQSFKSGDTVYFVMYYRKAVEKYEEIMAGADSMSKELLKRLEFSRWLSEAADMKVVLNTFRDTAYGYYDVNYALLGVEDFDAIWDSYSDIFWKVYSDDDEGTYWYEQYDQDIEALFAQFVALTPAKQFGFLMSVYTHCEIGYRVFDFQSGNGAPTNLFMLLLLDHYYKEDVMSSDAQAAFAELLQAIESFARKDYFNNTNSFDSFFVQMEKLEGMLAKMDPSDTSFMDSVGFAYEKYKAIYDLYDSERHLTVLPGEAYAEQLAKLESNCALLVDIAYGMENADQPNEIIFYALYEETKALYDALALQAQTDEDLFNYLTYGNIKVNGLSLNCEYLVMIRLRRVYTQYIQTRYAEYNGEAVNLWEIYERIGVSSFLRAASPVLTAYFSKTEVAEWEEGDVRAAMAAFEALSDEAKIVFTVYMDDIMHDYRHALETYLKSVINAEDVVEKLFDVEYLHFSYLATGDGKETLLAAIEVLKGLYANLEDVAVFDSWLGTLYTNYTATASA